MNPENEPIPGAPIVEAIIDIDCDLKPELNLDALAQQASEELKDRYPILRKKLRQEHVFTQKGEAPPKVQINKELGAVQFLSENEKQLLQFRPNGFSFNRLAPYNSMEDYLLDIKDGWHLFLKLTKPIVIRKIGIRMINRILLPIHDGRLELKDFLQRHPKLPNIGTPLTFLGFLDQHMAFESDSGNHINIIKTTEKAQYDKLPLILDIDAFYPCELDPNEWQTIEDRINSLRSLKNRAFRNTIIEEQCLNPS